ncbi:MAG: sodium:glutamate symporter [Kiritimatiellae bacterium]|jgi:ESS family glutamate:Na+ symporter|nr:sodium:glutamate symporter [Kiritimatiellia bacterium]
MIIAISFCFLCILVLVGSYLRMRVSLFHKLYIPSPVIAGLIGLVVIQSTNHLNIPLPETCTAGWSKIPGFFINIVFACLFLGVKLPPLRSIGKRAGMQLAYGQILVWGQYLIAALAVVFFLKQAFGLPDMFAGVLPVGFEGGHGTAAGLKDVFLQLGWPEGCDFALASATIGILSAIITGMILINWAARKGHITHPQSTQDAESSMTLKGIHPLDLRPEAGRLTIKTDALDSLSFHLCIVGLSIGIGVLIKTGLVAIEEYSPLLSKHGLLQSFPLFPLCMLGGLIIQILENKFDTHCLIDEGLMKRIQNTALDFLIVAAIATIKLDVVADGFIPLLILAALGISWNVICLLFLAPRIFKVAWFERAIAELGQSMGVTASGLLLLRVADPEYKTEAADAFAAKQLLHEPFMGGGLWTGMAIPLMAKIGVMPIIYISASAILIWIIFITVMRLRDRT